MILISFAKPVSVSEAVKRLPMQHRSPLREYFYFTRKERNGIMLLLLLSLAVAFFPVKKLVRQPAAEIVDDSLKRQLIALSMQPEADKDFRNSGYSDRRSAEGGAYHRTPEQWTTPAAYFFFDPNTLDAEGWRKLGMPDKNIRTLQHYLQKGGRFRQPGDLRKIWGIPPERAEQLIPYVKIDGVDRPAIYAGGTTSKPVLEKIFRTPASIDVNRADTTEWISLPGIGSRLASRIVAFRDKLGGFVSVAQVAETFGLRDSTYQLIRSRLVCSSPDVRKIHINRATVEVLKAHPYIRYQIAGAIIQYRKQHGDFARVDDLMKLVIVTPEIFARVSPYLTVGE
jgi:DNA uptake protein ComE-like DNA-binding protein